MIGGRSIKSLDCWSFLCLILGLPMLNLWRENSKKRLILTHISSKNSFIWIMNVNFYFIMHFRAWLPGQVIRTKKFCLSKFSWSGPWFGYLFSKWKKSGLVQKKSQPNQFLDQKNPDHGPDRKNRPRTSRLGNHVPGRVLQAWCSYMVTLYNFRLEVWPILSNFDMNFTVFYDARDLHWVFAYLDILYV